MTTEYQVAAVSGLVQYQYTRQDINNLADVLNANLTLSNKIEVREGWQDHANAPFNILTLAQRGRTQIISTGAIFQNSPIDGVATTSPVVLGVHGLHADEVSEHSLQPYLLFSFFYAGKSWLAEYNNNVLGTWTQISLPSGGSNNQILKIDSNGDKQWVDLDISQVSDLANQLQTINDSLTANTVADAAIAQRVTTAEANITNNTTVLNEWKYNSELIHQQTAVETKAVLYGLWVNGKLLKFNDTILINDIGL
jgi:hypothetical protein